MKTRISREIDCITKCQEKTFFYFFFSSIFSIHLRQSFDIKERVIKFGRHEVKDEIGGTGDGTEWFWTGGLVDLEGLSLDEDEEKLAEIYRLR
jgi:hypothetical protein